MVTGGLLVVTCGYGLLRGDVWLRVVTGITGGTGVARVMGIIGGLRVGGRAVASRIKIV